MNTPHKLIISLLIVMLLSGLSSCGGGGTTAGIGGTGISAVGSINGFGSIFVNGIEFETGNSSISVDDASGAEGDLRLGMVVKVTGTVNDDGITGTANSVSFDDAVQGPVQNITPGPDGLTKSMTVMGRTVIVDDASTLLEGTTFATLADNDVIEVSGFTDNSGHIIASRVKYLGVFSNGISEVEFRGLASNIAGTQFDIASGSNIYTVETAGADLSEVQGGVVTDGMLVEIRGTQPSIGSLVVNAYRVQQEGSVFGEDEDHVSLEGIITNYVDDSHFMVLGQSVDASGASFDPASLILGNDMEVEIEGSIVGGILIATEVEARSGEFKAQARVLDVDAVNNNFTLDFLASTQMLVVYIDNKTTLEDELGINDPYTLNTMFAGDYLELKGYINGGQVIATEVHRKEEDEPRELLQGPASACDASGITILGVSFLLPGGITYEDTDEAPISNAAFCDGVMNDGLYARVLDVEPNGSLDGAELED